MKGIYPVVTLCGSTRFKDEFYKVQKELTLKKYKKYKKYKKAIYVIFMHLRNIPIVLVRVNN